jgi:hypothetical protein
MGRDFGEAVADFLFVCYCFNFWRIFSFYLSCGEWSAGDLPPLARDMAVLTVASTGSI